MQILEHRITIMRTESAQFVALDADGGIANEDRNDSSVAWYGPVRVVGTVTLNDLESHTPCVRTLHVDPAYRGRGIGSALLARCVETARLVGARRVEIQVDPGNTDAARMYGRRGFVPVGLTPRGNTEMILDLLAESRV